MGQNGTEKLSPEPCMRSAQIGLALYAGFSFEKKTGSEPLQIWGGSLPVHTTNLPPHEFSPSHLKHVPATVNGMADSFFCCPVSCTLCNPAWPMTFLNQKRKGCLLQTESPYGYLTSTKYINNIMKLFVNSVDTVLDGHPLAVFLLSILGTSRVLAV